MQAELPSDMDSFPHIEGFDALTAEQKKEKTMIEEVLKRFARTDVGGPHSFHQDPSRKLSEREKEKMRLMREKLEEHLKQFN